ncbi:MAG: fibrobacter succinogenes major paralogous domain-containing protein, partial [Bacteroidales bacterium]|nr:fibrobacter succinogenes major paralogous domain-containing protein [Bacteroidales bacterium]
GGNRNPGGYFYSLTSNGHWWSSSESGSDAWTRILHYDVAQVYHSHNPKSNGFSVRCLRD